MQTSVVCVGKRWSLDAVRLRVYCVVIITKAWSYWPYDSLLLSSYPGPVQVEDWYFLTSKKQKQKQKPNALDKQQSPILGLKYLRLLQGGPSVRQCVI